MKTNPAAKSQASSIKQQLLTDRRHEEIVVQALQECQAAIDAGELLDREAILAKYPSIRDELSACLEGLELLRPVREMDATTPSNNNSRTSVGQSLSPLATLGDFRIERELGRGGMGVVYEAEQLSVGRKVALKVLPYAAMLDKRQVARFQNEARAAATLEHPNIVPVYFVGNERGVYYYAMRLIDGKNLAEVLEELRGDYGENAALSRVSSQLLRSPLPESASELSRSDAGAETVRDLANDQATSLASDHETSRKVYFESVARLAKQTAEALEFAHSHGIIHRDVKPANIMLDDLGDAWITDFGLARIEADAGITMTGDIVGTLRYMSPEQTLAKRVAIDNRSDVYSLGATLYELLTLAPIFEAEDRATLLKRIAFDSPINPTKLNAGIPYDLETVVLKSLSKNPDDRYESAGAMASDLQRFLSHQPVKARRTPVLQRMKMWTRRHPTFLVASSLLLLGILISASVAGLLIAKKERDARISISAALEEKADALEQSDRNLQIARENLQIALTTVNELNRDFAKNWIASDQDLTTTQINYLNQSARILAEIAAQFGEDPQFRLAAGTAYLDSGAALERLANFRDAEAAYSNAISLLKAEVASGSNEEKVRSKLGLSLLNLGDLRVKSGRPQLAPQAYAEASEIYKELRVNQAADVEYGFLLVHAKQGLAHMATMTQDAEEALRLSKEIIDDLKSIAAANEDNREKAFAQRALTVLEMIHAYRELDRLSEAEQTAEEFLATARLILRNRKDNRNLIIQLAAIQSELAHVQMNRGAYEIAEKNHREALSRTRDTFLYDGTPMQFMGAAMLGEVSDDQMSPMAFKQYAEIQTRLAMILLRTGRDVEGFVQVDESLRVLSYFDEIYPGSIEYIGNASNAMKVYGRINLNVPAFKDGAEVLIRGKRSQADLKEEQRTFVDDIYFRLRDRAKTYPRQFLPVACDVGAIHADLLNKSREHAKAMKVASGIVSFISELSGENSDSAWKTDLLNNYQQFKARLSRLNLENPADADTFARRAMLNSMEGDHEAALADYTRAIDMQPAHAFSMNAAAWILGTSSEQAVRDGTRAVAYATRACELTNWEEGGYLDTLAAAHAQVGDFEKAVEWQTKAKELAPAEEQQDYQSRLDLYLAGKPYIED